MTYRKPNAKQQASQLQTAFKEKGSSLGRGEALELVARLNGYPSWNVAKTVTSTSYSQEPLGRVEVWTALHHHRHGTDVHLFTHAPSEAEVIAEIEVWSTWEPEDENIDIYGPEVVEVPCVKAAASRASSSTIGMYEICVLDHVDYEDPEDTAEWKWIQTLSSFAHTGNGNSPGVWEFMVHRDRLQASLSTAPPSIKEAIEQALASAAVWVMFHQG